MATVCKSSTLTISYVVLWNYNIQHIFKQAVEPVVLQTFRLVFWNINKHAWRSMWCSFQIRSHTIRYAGIASVCAIMTRENSSWSCFNQTSKLTACVLCHNIYDSLSYSSVNYIVIAIIDIIKAKQLCYVCIHVYVLHKQLCIPQCLHTDVRLCIAAACL